MKIALFEPFSGVAGDMILGALVDAGLPLKKLEGQLKKLKLKGWSISARKVKRAGLTGTKIEVKTKDKKKNRSFNELKGIIAASTLERGIKKDTIRIMENLARAEGKAHGEPLSKVRLEQAGAIDAVIDIVGSVAGLKLMGVKSVCSTPINTGSGTVKFHGKTYPVPAPATAQLLKRFPFYSDGTEAELTTPTGAAIITTLAQPVKAISETRSSRIGYGAGTRNIAGLPNLLRLIIGESQSMVKGYEQDTVSVIETNIDDADPRIYDYLMEKLFKLGALDVYLTPIIMKKTRPAVKLSVLAEPDKIAPIVDAIFAETPTFGLRIYQAGRFKLPRKIEKRKTKWGTINVKVGFLPDGTKRSTPDKWSEVLRILKNR